MNLLIPAFEDLIENIEKKNLGQWCSVCKKLYTSDAEKEYIKEFKLCLLCDKMTLASPSYLDYIESEE